MDTTQVVLVNPAIDIESASAEPLALEYIAAFLIQNGIKVKIIDEIQEKNTLKAIQEYKPDLVGITAMTPVINRAYEIADKCRKNGIKTVLGGVHATIFPEDALKHSDIVVVGDGEYPMLSIIRDNITEGIINGEFVKDLNEMPFPARELVNIEYYLKMVGNRWFFGRNERTGILITSRGCPYRCTFCHNSTRQSPVRYYSPEKVVEEIKFIMHEYHLKSFFFIDDDFISNKKRFFKIADLIEQEGITFRWSCNSRTNPITDELVQRAKQIGCEYIYFGFESGSQKILDVLNKKSTVEKNAKAIDICDRHGVKIMGGFMIGNPTETKDDIELTKQFIINHPIDFVGLCITTPFPGTKLWEYSEEKGLLPENLNWDNFNVSRPQLGFVPNTEMTYKEVIKSYEEVDNIIESKKQDIHLQFLVKIALKSPIKAIKQIFRSRKRLFRYLKRLKF